MILHPMDVDYLNQLPYGTTARARRRVLLITLAMPALFTLGAAVGWTAARYAPPVNRPAKFAELALICLPIQTAPDDSPYRPARLDPPAQNSFTCFGGTRP